MSKQSVSITLSSIQTDEGMRESTSQTHMGSLYEKNDGRYLLYRNEDEGVSTSIRLAEDEIRLFRHGGLESWQTFRLGEITGGMLTFGVNPMILRVLTSHFLIAETEAGGHVELHYQLWTSANSDPEADPQEVSLGRFELTLDWTFRGEA